MDKIKAFFKKFKKIIIGVFIGIAGIFSGIFFIILYTIKNDNPTIDNDDIKKTKEELDAGEIGNVTNSDVDHWYDKFIGKRKNN